VKDDSRIRATLPVTGSLLDFDAPRPASLLMYFAVQAALAGGMGAGAGALVGVLAAVLDVGRLETPLVVIGALSGLTAGLIAAVTGREVLPRLADFSLAVRITLGVLTLGGGAFAATGLGFWLYPRYSLHAGGSVLLVGSINGLLALVVGLLVFLYEDLNRRLAAAREQLAAERLAQAEARERAARAELQALQARINPHFFFNALNTAAALVREDPQAAERLLERFSDLFRYAFRRGGEERVPLEDELAFITDYLAIEEARFGGRLQFAVEGAPDVRREPIPPLILQPLVENSVVHGRDPDTGEIRVVVRAWRERDGRVVLEVRDKGPGLADATSRPKGHALRNIATRLAARGGRLEISPAEDGGTRAQLVLPPRTTRW
jgi:two-component system sensor histidine kinase AlgZ